MCIDNSLVNLDSSYYYTLSTIAQVLAGFLALSGVFVIRKIDLLNKYTIAEIESFKDRWHHSIGNHKIEIDINIYASLSKNRSTAKYYFEDLKLLIYRMKQWQNKDRAKNEIVNCEVGIFMVNQCIEEIMHLDNFKQVLIYMTKKSLYTGLFSIVFSIIFLSKIPSVYKLPHSFGILKVLMTGCIISLIIMVLVIIFSIEEYPDKNILYRAIKRMIIFLNPEYAFKQNSNEQE